MTDEPDQQESRGEDSVATPRPLSKRNRTIRKWAAFTTGWTTVVAVAGLVFAVGSWVARIDTLSSRTDRLLFEIEDVREEIDSQAVRLESQGQRLTDALEAEPPSDIGPELADIRAQLADLQERLAKLESALQDSPEKALAIPLLRKDLESLRLTNQTDLVSIRREVERVYDQNKWFIALMLGMAAGVLGMAVTYFVQLRRPE